MNDEIRCCHVNCLNGTVKSEFDYAWLLKALVRSSTALGCMTTSLICHSQSTHQCVNIAAAVQDWLRTPTVLGHSCTHGSNYQATQWLPR